MPSQAKSLSPPVTKPAAVVAGKPVPYDAILAETLKHSGGQAWRALRNSFESYRSFTSTAWPYR
ncbi:hypothetical protein CpipJ_CPIJ006526 [Culex quinquefasciatus]|uniref:Uncharacterized protein n=1 Tax=Culex quinquefasciatus TaxID=7176 RepID=B0WHM6_CULQU|nr:hypothetical protein CpipJ_CPIJ006526 [Culex quinquefasciatus]|eukprot:XP_001848210.1 hypothetical protein CpipJ_CPIJ006526 [Culex quinquefasciatus]